ncbi:unnamed protein product, partial [marine sediment metagenome]
MKITIVDNYTFWGYNYEYYLESYGNIIGYRLYDIDNDELVEIIEVSPFDTVTITI